MSAVETISRPDLGPVSLNYVAALRGVAPRAPGAAFAYASVGCDDVHELVCRAASNPEGRFFGIMDNDAVAAKANDLARGRATSNILFLAGPLPELVNKGKVPALDYLVWDAGSASCGWADRDMLFAFAEKTLKPGGLLACSYRAYDNHDEALRFLVNEFSPEMDAEQAKAFLGEIKALGGLYFAGHPIARAALDRAIAAGNPDEFFSACDAGDNTASGTFVVMSGLLPRGFAFAGSADIRSNYMELTTPPEAHAVLEGCREHLLYEPIKDFAMNRLKRHDLWCRLPANQTDEPAALFGSFTFGMTRPREEAPSCLDAGGKTVDLLQPPFAAMIDVMSLLPLSVGDFLKHPSGQGFDPLEVLAAFQVLVAVGIARPMRGRPRSMAGMQMNSLKWATAFNEALNTTSISGKQVVLASEVVGGSIVLSAREALVLQALGRVGVNDSAGALLMELERIAKDPALAAQMMDVAEPTPAMAENMVKDILGKSMMQWCAYGLLAA